MPEQDNTTPIDPPENSEPSKPDPPPAKSTGGDNSAGGSQSHFNTKDFEPINIDSGDSKQRS